jgi:quercetin dioxygenase-like cupin family protein
LVNPYEDNNDIRTFSESVNDSELVWHRDTEDRIVTVLEGEGWQFQMDNELPMILEEGTTFFIPKMTYHRILKGKTDLRIRIKENNKDV